MQDTLENIIKFLHEFKFKKTLDAFQKEISTNKHIIYTNNDYHLSLIRKINKILDHKEIEIKKEKKIIKKRFNKKKYKELTDDETEKIMENFMNRLFKSINILNDENLNPKIEKIFENKTFQKMVEKNNVLEDAEDLSEDRSINDQLNNLSKIIDHNLLKNNNIIKYEESENSLLTNYNLKEKENKLKNKINNKLDNIEQSESIKIENKIKEKLDDLNEISKIPSINDDKNSLNNNEIYIFNDISIYSIEEEKNANSEGYDKIETNDMDFDNYCMKISKNKNYINKIVSKNDKYKNKKRKVDVIKNKELHYGYFYLPHNIKHPNNKDNFFPKEYEKSVYDYYNIKVIFERERTGFEDSKDYPIIIGAVIAGRYEIVEYLGSATFCKAVNCYDRLTQRNYCMKIIDNNKDYFDQSIDEIKILNYIKVNGNLDKFNILKIYDYFYYKEHLFIVTELLKENLSEYLKFNLENEEEKYFTIPILQKITKQILIGLDYIHNLKLIHCDLKPENILIKSYSNNLVKIIDFGSSCFIHDHLASYVQSRPYRAPEIILGNNYDYKIDLWSLGCVLFELYTGDVLFTNENMSSLLARIISICGPIPKWMMEEGKLVNKYFTDEKVIYGYKDESNENSLDDLDSARKNKDGLINLYVPRNKNLRKMLNTNDENFLDFIKRLLQIDPNKRLDSKQALNHSWIKKKYN